MMRLRSGRLIVRRKNIYLPTEVWVDVFCFPWITRRKLAKMVDKIGNRWFGEQLQFYLHEWGKRSLGHLHFGHHCVGPTKLPRTAMPENFKHFNSIRLEEFDNRVFNSFHRIQSVLTADTKLEIHFIRYEFFPNYTRIDVNDFNKQVKNIRFILGLLLPLIDGVHTLYTDDRMLPKLKSLLGDRFHQIKVLNVKFTRFVQSAMRPTMEWLTSNNNDEPELLELHCVSNEIAQQAMETIRKQFMEATEPSTFCVIFTHNYYDKFVDFQCENGIGEQLCGMTNANEKVEYSKKFKVFRHQANAEAGNQLREWLAGNGNNKDGYRKGCIQFVRPYIGSEEIFALEDEADENEDDDDWPSTSREGAFANEIIRV